MGKLTNKIKELEVKVAALEAKLKDISLKTEEREPTPYSKVGQEHDKGFASPVDPGTGLGGAYGGQMIWNDIDANFLPLNTAWGEQTPSRGYNRHSHSRFSGGALEINTLEFVEYDIELASTEATDVKGNTIKNYYKWDDDTYNKDMPQHWRHTGRSRKDPDIKKSDNSDGEEVLHIGPLDLVFNPDTKKWSVTAAYIDVEKTYLVQYETDKSSENYGNIKLDGNSNSMSAPLYDEDDSTKSAVVWDSEAKVWRFYTIYRD